MSCGHTRLALAAHYKETSVLYYALHRMQDLGAAVFCLQLEFED